MANNSAGKNKVIADSERIIARMLAVMLRRRMKAAGMDVGGVDPWAYTSSAASSWPPTRGCWNRG